MIVTSEFVQASFNEVSFGLDGDYVIELIHVVSLQVDGLLAQYAKCNDGGAAMPAQVAIMVAHLIGELNTNLTNIQYRMRNALEPLLTTFPRISVDYVKSLEEITQSFTGLTQFAKNTVMAKLKLFLGSAGPVVNAVDFLVDLGFTEPMADFY